MSDENNTQSNLSGESTINTVSEKSHKANDDAKITINKSTYNNMIKGVIAAIAITAFFGGYFIGTYDNSESGISSEELDKILTAIQKAPAAQPAPQPTQQPTQPNVPQIFQISLDDDPFKGDCCKVFTVVWFNAFNITISLYTVNVYVRRKVIWGSSNW